MKLYFESVNDLKESNKSINDANTYYSRPAKTFTLDEFEKELESDMHDFLVMVSRVYGIKEAESKLNQMLSRVIRRTSTI